MCHRDLKLENIVLGGEGGNVVKIVDFGLSKSVAIHSDPSTVVGTVSYMAPEVIDIANSRSSVMRA